MTTAVIRLLAAEGESRGVDLPLEPWAIGVGAFVLLCVLLAVTLTFGKDR
jgi:hypothetical protein